jgi:hypothetical protein
MWILAGMALMVVVYGVYTTIDGQRKYHNLSDKIADIVKRRETFTQQFPTAGVNGEIKPDLTNATQSDVMFIAMLRRDENDAKAQRVDADNQRRTGVRLIGIGVIGLALAYLVLPDRKSRSSSEGVTAASSTSDEAATK